MCLISLKTWIEDLFRPVITITQRGARYIERTPTIDDIDLWKRRQYARVDYTANPASTEAVWELLWAANSDYVIWAVSFTPNLAIPNGFAWIQIGEGRSTANVSTLESVYAIAPGNTNRPYSMIVNPPVYVKAGHLLMGRSTTAGGAAVAHSYHCLVTYSEVLT